MKRWTRRLAAALCLALAAPGVALSEGLDVLPEAAACGPADGTGLFEVWNAVDGPAQVSAAEDAPVVGQIDPTPGATVEPTPEITAEPTPEVTPEPTSEPTAEPTPEPTGEPTSEPTVEPTVEPTEEPTVEPTVEPTPEPTPVPETVTLNAEAVTLGVGESFLLKPVTGTGEGAAFTYRSSKSAVAKVSKKGKIVGVKRGRATITVTGPGGATAECRVVVRKAPGSIALNAAALTLGWDAPTQAGTRFQLAVSLPKNTASKVIFTGYDLSVIDVSPEGLVVAKGVGTTKLTAKTFNKKKAVVTVRVLPAPDAVSLGIGKLVLAVGEECALAATLPEGTEGELRYESSAPKVVAVDAVTGMLTCLGVGKAVVTAACFNGASAKRTVVVRRPADKVKLSAKALTLGKGEAAKLTAKLSRKDGAKAGGTVRYESSRPDVAAVDDSGAITAAGLGTATITATAAGGAKAACAVQVLGAPDAIAVAAELPKLSFDPQTGKGSKTRLTVTLPRNTASGTITYTYDPEVVKVSAAGKVTAVGPGRTTVTAATYNGMKASCVVRVLKAGEPRTVNVAHRGGMGYWPENTLEAFGNSASTGAAAIELDVQTTKDGCQVVHHDETLVSGGRRYTIAQESLERLRQLKPSLCTLEEAVDVIRESGLELHLEMKKTADPAKCVDIVTAGGMAGRTIYISFQVPLLEKIRALVPDARIALVMNETPRDFDAIVARLDACAVCQNKKYLTLANLRKWQNRGLLVGSWTLDEQSEIDYWLGLDVDLVTSNYPRRVTEALE